MIFEQFYRCCLAHASYLAPLAARSPAEVRAGRQQGATSSAAGHVPASVQIGLRGQVAAWAGTTIGLDRELILIAEDPAAAEESRLRLSRAGIDPVWGVTPHITGRDLHRYLAEFTVVDVRASSAWQPLNALHASLPSLDPAAPLAVHCKGGYRSTIACSLPEVADAGTPP